MISYIKIFSACFLTIIIIDYLWIGLLMKNFYIDQLSSIGRINKNKFEPVIWAAMVVYLALVIGIIHYALPKIYANTTWLESFGIGALLGFVIYATYDFTNYSTLKNWTLSLSFVDVVWGSFLGGLVTCVGRYIRDLY